MRALLSIAAAAVSVVACGDGFTSNDCRTTRTCSATAGSGTSGSSGTGGSSTEGGSEGAGTSSGGGGSGVSGGGGSGATSGNGGAGDAGGCEGDVSDDAACWATSEYGVFVSNEHGDDATGTGTKEAPFATITKGLSAAGGKKVFVCLGPKGDYTDALTLDQAEDVSIYGGFECETWEYSTSRKAGIRPTRNIGIRISRSKNVLLENLRITASDATGSGYDASSYGAFVTESEGVVLRRVELKAGNGAKGADGADGAKGANGAEASDDQNGDPGLCSASSGFGGEWAEPVCGTRGGSGGRGEIDTDGGPGSSGIPNQNVTPAGVKNFGAGAIAPKTSGDDGTEGSPGDDGKVALAGSLLGSFAAAGYTAADGKAGEDGFPGQGGGGGGASQGTPMCRGASGGAGGMGGCGGTAGKGGSGGGASVGLMSWSSEMQLEDCSVASAMGGAGGKGGAGGGPGIGADGGAGGDPDGGAKVARGGKGGAGGNGGIGGSGSGGTGGASYGIVFHGTKPLYTEGDSKIISGAGGAAGPGGQLDMDAPKAPDGAQGVSGTELEVE